jgi:hypothetical protein
VTEAVVCTSMACTHERRTCRGCPVLTCRWTLDERGECVACEWRRNRAARVSAAPTERWAWACLEFVLSEPVRARRRAA